MAAAKRAKTTESEPTIIQIPNTQKQGSVYLLSIGDPYKAPKIDAKKLKAYSKNYYGAGVTRKLIALFFGDSYEIEVKDQKGNLDEALSEEIFNMASAKDVALFSKMKMGHNDKLWLGMGIFNPIWIQEGATWRLNEIRRLPPESFSRAAQKLGTGINQTDVVPGAILKGIIAMPDGQMRYFQTNNKGGQEELYDLYTVKESTCPEVAGEPDILPVTPLITMLDYAWKAQMQKTHRLAAPILLLHIENPTEDDIKYGEKLLRNWGKDTGFILRSNMTVADYNLKDTATALETIEKLTEMCLDYWVPTSMLAKNGQLIGGNSNSDLSLLYSYIAGVHREIEQAWEPLLQIYLDANGYEGHRVKIRLKDPEIDSSELKLNQAKVGADTGRLTDNEIRTRLGAPELTDEELAELPCNKQKAPAAEQDGAGENPFDDAQDPDQDPTQDPEQEDPEQAGKSGTLQKNNKRVEVKKGTPGAKQDPKTGKYYMLKQSTKAKAPEKDPNQALVILQDKEQRELEGALDALAKAVISKL